MPSAVISSSTLSFLLSLQSHPTLRVSSWINLNGGAVGWGGQQQAVVSSSSCCASPIPLETRFRIQGGSWGYTHREEALTRILGACSPSATTSFWLTCPHADLSTTTIERNAELEARVTELELELVVWKQARNNAVDMVNRDKDAHNARVAALNRQMNSLDIVKVRLM